MILLYMIWHSKIFIFRNCSVPLQLRAKIRANRLWRWNFCLAAERFLTVSAV